MKTSQIILVTGAFVFGCGLTALLMQQNREAQPERTSLSPEVDAIASEVDGQVAKAVDLPEASAVEVAQARLNETLNLVGGDLRLTLDLSVDLGRGNYEDRFLTVTRLKENLSDSEVTALAQFLYLPFSEQQGMTLLEFNALKNEIMGKLVSIGSERVDSASVFSDIARSAELDDLIRDYAIQFSYHLYEESQYERETVAYDRSLAQMALAERDTTLAGTALLGEVRLSEANPDEYPSKQTAALAWDILNDGQTLEANRVTAMSALTRLGDERVVPKARNVIESGQGGVLLISALGTVREFGDVESIPQVRRIAASTNPSLSRAARYTLKHLESL